MDAKAHWEAAHRRRVPGEQSWFQPTATASLELIGSVATPGAAIVDVGGGTSSLVDGLLDAGYHDLTVLDLSLTALQLARERLGPRAAEVRWLVADVLTAPLPPRSVDLWHDRAVFHFLTAAVDRAAYLAQVRRVVRPGGFVLVATFAEDGPTRCSGLEVCRYSATELHAAFGAGFRLLRSHREPHVTPAGVTQSFVYCLFRFEPGNAIGPAANGPAV